MSQEPGPAPPGLGGLISGRRSLFLAIPVVVLLTVVVVVAFASGGGDGAPPSTPAVDDHDFAGLKSPEPEATLDPSALLPTVVPTVDINPQAVGDGDRLVIAKFGVNAPLTLKTVGTDGVMPNPNGPDDIAIYNFSAWPGKGGSPGLGGNTVLAGHVDSGTKACKNGSVPPPCQAVLWDLNGLRNGDEIELRFGGQSFRYRVTSNQPVSAASGPWDQIVSSTAQESITIITCGGDFNRQTREYSNRQVVTAVRV
jgi:hypothetical protein